MKRVISEFLFDVANYPTDLQYDVSDQDLITLIVQVDKRCAHYEFFHHGMQINENKKRGIYIYWFLKFKPIRLLDDRFKNRIDSADINEYFSVMLLGSVLAKLGRDKSFLTGGPKLFEELRYSFRFRTFTVGSMMVLADSFF
ncbi:hypothetical protein ACYULU_15555 [Breznakiellaceae bacterium SP9]